jgi:hypothetical protein
MNFLKRLSNLFTERDVPFDVQALRTDLRQDLQQQQKELDLNVQHLLLVHQQLRQSVWGRIFKGGGSLLIEIILYLLTILLVIYIFVMERMYPFDVAGLLATDKLIVGRYGISNLGDMRVAIKVFVAALAISCFIIARLMRGIRLKNSNMHSASSSIKLVLDQQQQRKNAVDNLLQQEPPQEDIPPVPHPALLPPNPPMA